MRRATSVALLLAAFPAALAAQRAKHRVATGDTLRWREMRTTITTSEVAGTVETRSEVRQEGEIRVARGAGDTVVIWYDRVSATVGLSGTSVSISLPFEAAAPVRVLLSDSGCVRVFDDSGEAAPSDMWKAMAAARKPTPPYDDLFIPLPSVPLAVGVSWPMGTQVADSASRLPGRTTGRSEPSYRVVRDTTVEGSQAFVIETQFGSASQSNGRSVNMLTIADSRMSSEEKGIIVFDPVAGRVIARRTTTELRTAMTMESESGGSIKTKSTSISEHRLELMRP